MILLTLLFKLGVRFAIFNFIWFFLELAHKMLTGMRPPFLAEHYILKAIKYVLLVSITFAYCLEFAPNEPTYVLNWQKLVPGGLILMLYLLGKFQKQQEQIQFLAGFQMPIQQKPYSKNLEIALLVLSALTFTGLYFYPQLTEIGLLQWFESNMHSLEKAFLLGFVFQVLGFFFVVSVFLRLISAFSPKPPQSGPQDTQDPDQFTDYEEVSDKHLD
ncbi:MAG: hypothetical protein RLZZ211_2003 [Bacteroidota bacterium]|jgi:hypothetical protein